MSVSFGNRNAIAAALAVLFGFGGLVLVFSDPVEGWPVRIAVGAAYFLVVGLGIGYANPGGWLISMLAAWGGVLMGAFIIFMSLARYGSSAFAAAEPPYITSGLAMLFGTLGLSFLGGIIGRSLSPGRTRTAR